MTTQNEKNVREAKVALCYVRQSFTRDDDDRNSPERQRANIEAVLARKGWEAEWYEDADGHKSARHERNRPGWLQLKTRLGDSDVVALVANEMSRLHRKGWRVGDLIDHLERHDVALELSPTKTLVTHARTESARFLGYQLRTFQDDQRRSRTGPRINGIVSLEVPMEVIREKSQRYRKHGKPVHRPEWMNDGVYDIIVRYQQEYRGLVEYYRLAHNLYQLDRLKYVMETSLTKTLSRKLRISVSRVYQRFGTVLLTENGPYKGLQYKIEREGKRPLIATWGGISLKRDLGAELNDAPLGLPVNYRTELEQRLLADTCELCGSTDRIEVHHVRALRDLKRPGRKDKPLWMQVMITRHRKTLVVCWACHQDITAGRPVKNKLAD